ncbi:MAG: hypothetical protein AVDCRST_MAG56-6724, partial [uncultured Cytophagales bacterium]
VQERGSIAAPAGLLDRLRAVRGPGAVGGRAQSELGQLQDGIQTRVLPDAGRQQNGLHRHRTHAPRRGHPGTLLPAIHRTQKPAARHPRRTLGVGAAHHRRARTAHQPHPQGHCPRQRVQPGRLARPDLLLQTPHHRPRRVLDRRQVQLRSTEV